jgi:hypothetical protein
MTVQVYTMMLLVLERWLDITNSNNNIVNNKFGLILLFNIILIWFISFICSLPIILSIKESFSTQDGSFICDSSLNSEEFHLFLVIKYFISFFLPYLVILIFSRKLFICLNNSTKKKTLFYKNVKRLNYNTLRYDSIQFELEQFEKEISNRRKEIKIILLIVALFFIQWTPLWIFELYKSIDSDEFILNAHLINSIVSFVSYKNSISNPLLYFILKINFKDLLSRIY